VKFSPALRWLLVLLLPLTLAWKLATKAPDPNKARKFIVEFLERHDFHTLDEREPLVDIQIIEARSLACRLLVGNVSPYGVHTEIVQQLGAPTDRRFFVFRGTIYQQQPIIVTAVSYLGLPLTSRMTKKSATSFICSSASTPISLAIAPG
jgi:hypothetical protein